MHGTTGDHGLCKVDLHVHTRRYSPCAELLDPSELPARMQQAALSGLVLTEHDTLWPEAELADVCAHLAPGQRIYRGAEITAAEAHFVVVGLHRLGPIGPGIRAEELVRFAHLQGAVVILAHPHRSLGSSGPPRLDLLPDGIDAVEVPWAAASDAICRAAKARGWQLVSGSDAHAPETIGASYTEFPHLPADENDLARAIVAGLGVPRRRAAAIRSTSCL